ncbi:rifampicin phosphotransferase-like isoform X3 [Dermacentor albipictus]|uniref:rifampicin phosphotransferase-like isoform X3 n=1 Tax=Dermacentor albipictus TaxID=60249 RepID=UPI0038FCA572
MAVAAAAFTAAVGALLWHLYERALGIWMDQGLAYLLRYLVAVVRLTYLLRRKGRRFVYLESGKHDDVVKCGAVCAPLEWSKECPQQRQHLEKGHDEVLFFGANTDGDRLALSVSRLRNHVAQLWLALYTRDGRRYSLPTEVTLDRSTGSCFSAAGLRLQCLAPNRRWRVAFNGLLRQQSEATSATSAESEVHVKFGFIWSSVSHTLEQPAELAPAMLAEGCAEGSTLQMLRDIKRLANEMDSYDQAGMMSGEITVDGERRELCLWGYKIRNQGSLLDGACEENHHFGFLENGDMYHLVRTNNYGGKNGVYYGSIYAPASEMRSIDYAAVETKQELRAEHGKLHLRSGAYTLLASVRSVAPDLVFQSEGSACSVIVTAVDLKCEQYPACGFSVSAKRPQRRTCGIPGYLKHKIIEECQRPGESPLVSDIHNQCSKTPDLTGGKGSSLAVLDSIAREVKSFAVPRGFVVTTESYKVFSSSEHFQQLMRTMETAMTRDDWQTALKGICSSMVGALERLNMPADVQEAISQHLSKFDKDTLFAVRSSALGEDSEDMSAAGQMTTLLGVRGQDNVISAVVKCWASQFSFTNVNYKRQYGQALDVPMAVVVQELVNADTAGVMFTCDPLTGNPGYITVTANYGIGESVVSASAEPDTFVLKKRRSQRPTVESSQIGHKSVYTTTSGSDGVATVSVSDEKAQRACISEEDVKILASIGAQIEKTYTTPQDIEWALKDGIFFMLQCRPVTTFLRESDCEMLHEFNEGLKSAKESFTKGNVSEVLPGAASPLSMSFIRCAFDVNCRDTAMALVYASSPDRSPYITPWGPIYRYNYFIWLSDGLRRTGPDGNLIEKSLMYSILARDAGDEVEAGINRMRMVTRWKLPVQFYYFAKTMLTASQGVESNTKKSAELRLSVDEASTAEQIYDYIGRSFHHIREPAILLRNAATSSSFYNSIIISILSSARGGLDNEVFSELSKILRGTEAECADVPRMIQELGRVLRESAEKDQFVSMTTEEACKWLSTTESDCGKKYREFIKKHGHRAVKEFDVYTKPWVMDLWSLVKSLKAAAAAPQVEQKASAPWDFSKFPHRLSTIQSAILKLVAPRARAAVVARETTKSAAVRVIHQLRLLCHQLSRCMVCEGRLPSPEQLFFLTYEEIGILLRTRSPELVHKAQRRQKIYAEADKDRYPSIFVGIPKPIERMKRHVEGDFEIKGSPMSQGVVEGKVRVAKTFEEAHLIQKGEILVTTATDTGWTPYFPLLAGVVTEIGGPLSHGAVVAREYGLPCVVGIEGITTMPTSGDYVQLDGNTGVIRKIPLPEAEDD